MLPRKIRVGWTISHGSFNLQYIVDKRTIIFVFANYYLFQSNVVRRQVKTMESENKERKASASSFDTEENVFPEVNEMF